jgi:anti-sigma B factor antagonist
MPQTFVSSDPTDRNAAARSVEFRCTLRDGGLDAAWVRVAGDLDIATAPQLERTLCEAESRARRVVLDLRELTFLDSSGVHAIVDASSRASAAGRRLVLIRGPSQVDRVLALTKASDVLEIVDLDPMQPPVQALVQLARRDQAA